MWYLFPFFIILFSYLVKLCGHSNYSLRASFNLLHYCTIPPSFTYFVKVVHELSNKPHQKPAQNNEMWHLSYIAVPGIFFSMFVSIAHMIIWAAVKANIHATYSPCKKQSSNTRSQLGAYKWVLINKKITN